MKPSCVHDEICPTARRQEGEAVGRMIRRLWFRDLAWLRGLDLNQRPLGYEGKSGHHSNQDVPNQTNDDKDLPSRLVGAFWLISVGLLHSRFIAARSR